MTFIVSVILILKDKIRIIETAAKLIVEISGKQYQQAAVHQHAWQLPGKKVKYTMLEEMQMYSLYTKRWNWPH